jgi:hypothetical protein
VPYAAYSGNRRIMSRLRRCRRLLLICCACVASLPLHADITPSDLQVMARALTFLDKPLSGQVTVGIVYSADNPQSAREADELQRLLAGGLRVGNVLLKPLAVTLEHVAQANADVLFLTTGLGDQARSVAAASRARHLPCITTDLSQVTSGRCAVGVTSQPTVQILVNRTEALANGTPFSTLFRMMINEI